MLTRGIIPELLEAKADHIFFKTFTEREPRYKLFAKTEKINKAYRDDIRLAGVGRFQLMPEGMPMAFSNVVQGMMRRETPFNFALALRISYNARMDERWDMINKFVADLADAALDSMDRLAHGPINDGHAGSIYLGLFEGDGQRRSLWNTGHVPLRNTATTQSNKLNPGVAFIADGIKSALDIFATMQSEEERFIAVEPDMVLAHPTLRWDIETLLDSQSAPGTADNDINVLRGNKIGVRPHYSEKITDTDSWSLWKSGKDAVIWLERESLSRTRFSDDMTRDEVYAAFYRCQPLVGEWRWTVGSAPP
jgi:hypothetical protein